MKHKKFLLIALICLIGIGISFLLFSAHGVCFRKFFGELSIESRVRLSVRTLFVTPRHTASFPLRVSMARSLLMAAEDGFCKTACFE